MRCCYSGNKRAELSSDQFMWDKERVVEQRGICSCAALRHVLLNTHQSCNIHVTHLSTLEALGAFAARCSSDKFNCHSAAGWCYSSVHKDLWMFKPESPVREKEERSSASVWIHQRGNNSKGEEIENCLWDKNKSPEGTVHVLQCISLEEKAEKDLKMTNGGANENKQQNRMRAGKHKYVSKGNEMCKITGTDCGTNTLLGRRSPVCFRNLWSNSQLVVQVFTLCDWVCSPNPAASELQTTNQALRLEVWEVSVQLVGELNSD